MCDKIADYRKGGGQRAKIIKREFATSLVSLFPWVFRSKAKYKGHIYVKNSLTAKTTSCIIADRYCKHRPIGLILRIGNARPAFYRHVPCTIHT